MTQSRLKELFYYKDGFLYWKVGKSNHAQKDTIAGYQMDKRYWVISIDKKMYRAHRLIFLFHHGYLPKFLDHKDENKVNNIIENLRPATKSQNMANRGKQANNTSGFKGVSPIKGTSRYEAYIQINGKKKHLGRFDDPAIANRVYIQEAVKHHKEFAHG